MVCRIKPYAHDRLKWIVRGKENGKWVRKCFEKKAEAETFAQIKNTELLNQGQSRRSRSQFAISRYMPEGEGNVAAIRPTMYSVELLPLL